MNQNYIDANATLQALINQLAYDPNQIETLKSLMLVEQHIHTLFADLLHVASSLKFMVENKAQYSQDAASYKVLMATIHGDPMLMNQWSDLLMTIKLTNPDIEEQMKTVTRYQAF